MRVLFYTYSLQIGGAETVSTEYMLLLKEQGMEVCLVEDSYTDSFLSKKLTDAGIQIVSLWGGSLSSPLGAQRKKAARAVGLYHKLNRLLERYRPDVFHLNGLPDHLDKVQFPANRMIFTFHSRVDRNLRLLGEANTQLLKRMCARGMTLLTLTEEDRQEAQKRMETRRVLCIPNGVDFAQVRKTRYDRQTLHKLLEIPEEGFLVGTVGRLHEIKNHERLLAIFRQVKKQRPDACLLVVGGDTNGRMELLKGLAREYGVEQAVFFSGERRDADAILAAMDCFVLPSKSESFGLAAVEAQAQGVKSVVSQAVPQEVVCRENAISLSLDAPDEVWAQAILDENRKNPRPKDLEIFDIRSVCPRLIAAYEGLIHEE